MPLIKPRTRRIRVFRHISRLQEPNRDVLVGYAKFIGESPDYVLNQLIETTLAKDRDFLAWRATQDDHRGSPEAPAAATDLTTAVTNGDTP